MEPQLEQVLSHYNVLPSAINEIRRLPSGINYVYLIETSKDKLVLKNYKKLKAPYLHTLHNAVVQLAGRGTFVPPILQNNSGSYLTKVEKDYYDLSLYINHIDLSDQLTISSADLHLAGITLARLHQELDALELTQPIKKIDFKQVAENTLTSIEQFFSEFSRVLKNAPNNHDRYRLNNLKAIIEQTSALRSAGVDTFSSFFSQPYVPTHGDYSMLNVLIKPDRTKVFVTDWDECALRPLVWDVQAAISLFSLKQLGNAYFMQPDFDKMRTFLKAYVQINTISREHMLLLPEVAKYNFAVYWLSYTLPALLDRDYRLLSLIPDEVGDALYWLHGFHEYQRFIASEIKN